MTANFTTEIKANNFFNYFNKESFIINNKTIEVRLNINHNDNGWEVGILPWEVGILPYVNGQYAFDGLVVSSKLWNAAECPKGFDPFSSDEFYWRPFISIALSR